MRSNPISLLPNYKNLIFSNLKSLKQLDDGQIIHNSNNNQINMLKINKNNEDSNFNIDKGVFTNNKPSMN